jgi:hypothetical protein
MPSLLSPLPKGPHAPLPSCPPCSELWVAAPTLELLVRSRICFCLEGTYVASAGFVFSAAKVRWPTSLLLAPEVTSFCHVHQFSSSYCLFLSPSQPFTPNNVADSQEGQPGSHHFEVLAAVFHVLLLGQILCIPHLTDRCHYCPISQMKKLRTQEGGSSCSQDT